MYSLPSSRSILDVIRRQFQGIEFLVAEEQIKAAVLLSGIVALGSETFNILNLN
jgi:hypothetical protein